MTVRQEECGLGDADWLFAAFLGWTVVMGIARLGVLHLEQTAQRLSFPPLVLALALYQDVALAAASAWILLALLTIVRRRLLRRTICLLGWVVCAIGSAYSVFNYELYQHMHAPLTYSLLIFSERLDPPALSGSIFKWQLMEVSASPLVMTGIALLLCGPAAGWVGPFRRAFATPVAAGCLLLYFIVGHAWASTHGSYPVANPHLKLVTSAFEPRELELHGRADVQDFSDFIPPQETARAPRSSTAPRLPGSRSRPLSVVLFVMESVGTKHLELYGAPHHDSPELLRLAQRGAKFTRIYASQPWSQSALMALMISIYPEHFLVNLSRSAGVALIAGLPQVFRDNGYRTAFFGYDWEHADDGLFLRVHGVDTFDGEPSTCSTDRGGCDRALLRKALNWIKSSPSQPFFLVFWTFDSHYPYMPASEQNYGVSDPKFNRYLSSVRENDEMIGEVTGELAADGFEDDTLVAVVGDHGEAFAEHGHTIHGLGVYEEETHVPLLLANRRLFPQPLEIDTVGQQIDIAPTIVDLVGLAAPGDWQGRSLFAASRFSRAYLFTSNEEFLLGLVEDNLKYIYDPETGRDWVYDLSRDRLELQDLGHDSRYRDWKTTSRRRLTAWNVYERQYFHKLMERLRATRAARLNASVK